MSTHLQPPTIRSTIATMELLERCFNCNRIKDYAIAGTESLSGWICTYCEKSLSGFKFIRHDERTIARLSKALARRDRNAYG